MSAGKTTAASVYGRFMSQWSKRGFDPPMHSHHIMARLNDFRCDCLQFVVRYDFALRQNSPRQFLKLWLEHRNGTACGIA